MPSLGPDHVLVRIYAAGINPSDFANAILNRFGGKKPIVPGRDFAGVVIESPSNPALVGTEVYGTSGNELSLRYDGTRAEYLAISPEGLVPKPKGLSWAQAGAVGVPYTTAYLIVEKVRLRDSKDVVVVFGARGAVGRAVVEIANSRGCKTITVSRRKGCDVDLTDDSELNTVLELTNGKGPDVIIDCAGSSSIMEKGLAILGEGGRYGFISGMRSGRPDIKLNVMRLFGMNQSLVGINSLSLNLAESGNIMGTVGSMLEDGRINPLPQEDITEVALEEATAAYQRVAEMSGKKFVIRMK
jgi:NADPH:quinone reductase-like Zn-dependent oxidoreductase